jgi:hypothetical protein
MNIFADFFIGPPFLLGSVLDDILIIDLLGSNVYANFLVNNNIYIFQLVI